jgi:GTP1/Obg family GTP-binding protein
MPFSLRTLLRNLGIDQIPAKLIHTGCNTLCSETQKFVSSVSSMKELPQKYQETITALHKLKMLQKKWG